MDDYARATAVRGHVDKENFDPTAVKRARHFSPDCKDDIFQPSPFRNRRSEVPSLGDSDVHVASSVHRGYADVEDIKETAPYSNSFRRPTLKKPRMMPTETCPDSVGGVDNSCPLPSASAESEDFLEDILHRKKRVSQTTAFSETHATEKKGVSKYKQKSENASGYRPTSSSKVRKELGQI